MSLELRRATPEDARALAAAHVASMKAAYRGILPDSSLERFEVEGRADRFREAIESGAEETWAVEQGGEVVGFLTLGACRDADLDSGATGEIWGIYLAPSYWRKGHGRGICERAEVMLAARGFSLATLWVIADNDRARRFYEALGYAADGATRDVCMGLPVHAVRYRKDLPPSPGAAG